jgi:nuclear pore complex protein Nup155
LSLTFEDLITSQNGVAASRALVNVVIDQQIGQQIGVSPVLDLLHLKAYLNTLAG